MIVISHQNLLEAGCFDIPMSLEVTEKALCMFNEHKIMYPDKVSQIFNEDTQTRINCLPATIFPSKICGMKWVAVFPPNPSQYHLPNLNATILLSEIETGYPIAIMDGTLCSDLRTAAICGTAAKYLAKQDAQSIGYIGAGEQARMNFLSMMAVRPNLRVCRVASRTQASEEIFIQQMKKFYPNIDFIACHGDYCLSASDSDIIVTAISGQEPILKAAWVKPGAFYCHVGGWEDEYSVPLTVDKIICDDWNSVKHRTQTISRLFKMGKLKDEDIYGDLHEIVCRKKLGRTSLTEKIYFNTVGLSYVDVSLAYKMYLLVKEKSLQVPQLDFHKQSIFEIDPKSIRLT